MRLSTIAISIFIVVLIWPLTSFCDTRSSPWTRVTASSNGKCYVKFIPTSETLYAERGTAIVYKVLRGDCDEKLSEVELPISSSFIITGDGKWLVVLSASPEDHNGNVIECYHNGVFVWGHGYRSLVEDQTKVMVTVGGSVIWRSGEQRPYIISGGSVRIFTIDAMQLHISLTDGKITDRRRMSNPSN